MKKRKDWRHLWGILPPTNVAQSTVDLFFRLSTAVRTSVFVKRKEAVENHRMSFVDRNRLKVGIM